MEQNKILKKNNLMEILQLIDNEIAVYNIDYGIDKNRFVLFDAISTSMSDILDHFKIKYDLPNSKQYYYFLMENGYDENILKKEYYESFEETQEM